MMRGSAFAGDRKCRTRENLW